MTAEERTSYRSVVGQLMYLQTWTRPDLCTATSLAAQRTEKATISDILNLNKVVKDMQSRPGVKIVFPRSSPSPFGRFTLLAYGDSAFANAEGEKSQCGQCLFAVADVEAAIVKGDFTRCPPLTWASSTVKRVVRSTLSAEAYAVSESVEDAIWVRFVLDDLRRKGQIKSLRPAIEAPSDIPILQLTDSDNLEKSVTMDAGVVKDKRLRIVIAMLRQTFNQAARVRLVWIPTHLMVADALTKIVCVMVIIAAMGCRMVKFPPPVRKTAFSLAAIANIPLAKGQGNQLVKYYLPEVQELSYMLYLLLFLAFAILLGCVGGAVGGAAFAEVQETRRGRHAEAKGKARANAKSNAAAAIEPAPALPTPTGCAHKNVTNKGSNQWKLRTSCADCGLLLETIDTNANKERKADTAAVAAVSGASSSATAPTTAAVAPRRRAARYTVTPSSGATSSSTPLVTTTPLTSTHPARQVTARGKAAVRSTRALQHEEEQLEEQGASTDPDMPPLVDETDEDELL